jgi:hypothetical protein
MAWHRLTLSNTIASILLLLILVTLFEDEDGGNNELLDATRQQRRLLPNSLGDYTDPRSTSLRGGRKALEVLATAKTSRIATATEESTTPIEELSSEVDHQLQALLVASSDTQKQAGVNIGEPFSKVKVSYVTNFAAEPKAKGSTLSLHRREMEAALLANLHNHHFDQYVVFLDGATEEANCAHFIKRMKEVYVRHSYSKLTCIASPDTQPTYYQMFQNTLHEAVTGDIIVLANADQVFDDTVSLARTLHTEVLAVLGTRGFTNKMPALTKYFYESIVGKDFLANARQRVPGEWDSDRCSVTATSTVDAWIFHRSKMKNLKEEDFQRSSTNKETMMPPHMNEMLAESESAALSALQNTFPFTYNACDRVHSWHFHLSPELEAQETEDDTGDDTGERPLLSRAHSARRRHNSPRGRTRASP